jgi:hypothetical protein
MQYRKKPVVIDAVQLIKNNVEEVVQFIKEPYMIRVVWLDKANIYKDKQDDKYTSPGIWIKTLEGEYLAREGDYIIKGVDGEYYPCKPDIFEKTYEKVD